MSKTKVVLDSAGVRELLRSEELQALCMEHANRIQSTAGPGFVAEERNYPERTGAAVRTDSREAYYRNLNDNILLKAVRG